VTPVPIVSDKAFLGAPRWNPQGDRLAYLVSAEGDSAAADWDGAGPAAVGELRIFDFQTKQVIKATQQSRVRSFSWSPYGKRIFYAAGVNMGDVNAYHLDSLTLTKVTPVPGSPRNESNPSPKMLGDRNGLLYETSEEGSRKILWMDLKTREEKVLADSSGWNSLK
jgi:Tol biopolymer transport system component